MDYMSIRRVQLPLICIYINFIKYTGNIKLLQAEVIHLNILIVLMD